MAETIFSKIIRKEIKADIVFENENVLAFKDINPQAPAHILIIPKMELATTLELNGAKHASLLGEMMDAANSIAINLGLDKTGFRLVINCGEDGGQEVHHLHLHLLGGRKMNWPPG